MNILRLPSKNAKLQTNTFNMHHPTAFVESLKFQIEAQ